MSRERRKILDMLASGTIDAEDAERLLQKLAAAGEPGDSEPTGDSASLKVTRAATGPLKFLRIVVDSHDGDKVNIRVPLGLVRTGIKLSTMLPKDANEKLLEKGIDLSHLSELDGEKLIEELRDLSVDVDAGDGDKVRIFCE
jgi:hypothetical protein